MPNKQERDEEYVGVALMRLVALSALCWWLVLKGLPLLLNLIWPPI